MSKRNVEEYKNLHYNPLPNCGICVGLIKEDSYDNWRISLTGPKDTSYKGGLFFLNIHFPPEYPNKAPEVYFITPIYHLNVNPCAPKNPGDESLGHVCISTLNWWKPEYKIREVVLNIYSLFYMANVDSPYGINRAKEYKEERETYEEKAKYFTKKYASPTNMKNAKQAYERDKDWDFNL